MFKKVISYTLFLITLEALILPCVSRAQTFVSEKGKVEFISKASIETFTGTSNDLKGLIDLESKKIDFYIDLNTLRTGIALRDEHMRESYLETKKYPFAEFTGILNGYNSARTDTQSVIAVGTFSLHGVKTSRTIQGRLFVGSDHIYVEANWDVLLSDHKITIPKVLFLKLADRQEVRIQTRLNRKETP
jgi:polyisoprenoid-binding protein YceI